MFDFEFVFIPWWAGLSPWIRFGVALFLAVGSGVLILIGAPYWICVPGLALGTVLLFLSGPSRAERKGFHDF